MMNWSTTWCLSICDGFGKHYLESSWSTEPALKTLKKCVCTQLALQTSILQFCVTNRVAIKYS